MPTRSALVFGVLSLGFLAGQTSSGEPPTAPAANSLKTDPPVRVDHYGDPLPPGVFARLGTERLTMAGTASVLTFSADGHRLAAYDTMEQLRVWEVSSGKELLRLKAGPHGGSGDLTFSRDGKSLAKGCGDGTVRVWEIATGKELYRFRSPMGQVMCLRFSPDGKLLYAGGHGSPLLCWDLVRGGKPRKIGDDPSSFYVAFSRDGKTLIIGRADVREGVWTGIFTFRDMASGKELGRHTLTLSGKWTSELSPDGSLLARPEEGDKSITLLDPLTGREISRAQGSDYPANMAFSADSTVMTCLSKDGIVRVWDTATGKMRARFKALATSIDRIVLSPDGKRVALTGRADHAIHVWDVATGRELHSFAGHRAGPLTVAFRKDGKEIVTVSRDSAHVSPYVTEWADWSFRRWDAATGTERAVTRSNPKGEVYFTTFSADGRLLAMVIHDGTLRVWDVEAGKELRNWKVPTQEQTTVWDYGKGGQKVFKRPYPMIDAPVFSPDGKMLLAVHDPKVLRWDVATGQELPALEVEGTSAERVPWCAVSPDGQTLAVYRWKAPNESVFLLDAAKGKTKHRLKNTRFWTGQPVFSPDGRTFALQEIGGVSLWEVASGLPRGRLTEPVSARGLVFSPDGRFLAGGGSWPFKNDPTPVLLWDLATGQVVGRLRDDCGVVTSLNFSPDGSRLAVAGYFPTVLVCDVAALCGKKKLEEIAKITTPSPEELGQLWAELSGADSVRAYRAICQLGLTGPRGAAFLKARLQGDKPPDERRIARLIADLDDDQFATREKAFAELEKLGMQAEPALRRALEGKASVEVRARVQRLLERLGPPQRMPPTPQLVRLRVVEALEANGSPEARQALAELAEGLTDAGLTREAKASLVRLSRRLVPRP